MTLLARMRELGTPAEWAVDILTGLGVIGLCAGSTVLVYALAIASQQ